MSGTTLTNPGVWALALATSDGLQRQAARETLVSLGWVSTPVLVRLLDDPHAKVRWEAVLALKELADPSAAEALAEAMKDEDSDVRWVAAEALAAIGRESVKPLLRTLIRDGDSFELRDAAKVAISLQRHPEDREILEPVYDALKSMSPPDVVLGAASSALEHLKERERSVA